MSVEFSNCLRPLTFERHFTKHAPGSVLVKWGDTWVLVTVTITDKLPPFLRDTNRGWLTAEYSMLPGATLERKERDIKKLKLDARSSEISRLIGRSLRAALDFDKLGPWQLNVDCDVLQADGGTRCASITGGMVALRDAVDKLLAEGVLKEDPIVRNVAAVSVGICQGVPTLDLDYAHDSTADVDLNVIMTDALQYVEVQGTGEHNTFTEDEFATLRYLARQGLQQIFTTMNLKRV